MSSDVNAKLYEKLLLHQAEGRALFHPTVESPITGGTVGDCGYIKGGEFVQLFSVFDPPPGLLVGTLVKPVSPARRTELRPNPTPCFKSSEFSSIAVQGGAGTTFASFPVDLNANIALSKEESSFAFLAFSQQHHQRDQWFETRLLEDYLVDYESIIRRFYASYDIKGKLLIISGTIKTKGWCGGVASGISTSVNVQLQVDAAGQVLGNIGIAVTDSTTGTGPQRKVMTPWRSVVRRRRSAMRRRHRWRCRRRRRRR
ncbi:hypothetical protein EXIGLDRAFT_382606 [Exidia glandulosa HHB12029]|uniref:Uncharacterized protein n=1 Tax=Exidia glandulosa HHB12029 TaxID=1314781 RepID=A0A165ZCP6_EXIGL|nr:hypothetical protein EXIGLDRAFT_382606 [Exidia glandulosa HHB12029]